MDFHVQQQEASRLKQILFPRKTRASRSTVKSVFEMGKENSHHNRPISIRNQINKLKRGMQAFLDKQDMSPDNCLATPRQCLQIIKLMSDSLQNYGEEIQEAAKTLIQSIPQYTSPVNNSKYFLLHLKFNYLHTTFSFIKRRAFNDAFSLMKQESYEVQELIESDKKNQICRYNKMKLKRMLYLSSGFNSWRINMHKQRKQQAEETQLQWAIDQEANKIKLLSDESQMIVWLQKKIQADSDVCEVLIFNSKTLSLRSYITINPQDPLSSVFETVEDQSQAEEIQEPRGKTKRLEFNLDHSLTKICLIKKQVLKIQDIRKDPDYSKIDNITSTHGLSSRQMIGGAIFTPILNQSGQSIGIIRQYYFDKPGSLLKSQTVLEVGQFLERGIKTSQIIESVKQKSEGIRKQYYLKSIQIMNEISCQQDKSSIEETFQKILTSSFPITGYRQYNFQTVNLLTEKPKFIITSEKGTQVQHIQILSALGKMHMTNSSFVFQENCLIIKTLQKVYIVDLVCSEEGVVDFVPIPLVKHLFCHKQGCIQQKMEEQNLKKKEDEKKKLDEYKRREEQRKKQIVEYCLNCCIPESINGILGDVQKYCDKFVGQEKIKISFRLNGSDTLLLPESSQILHQNAEFKILLSSPTVKAIKKQQMQTIKNFTNHLITILLKPNLVNTQNLDLVATSIRHINSPQNSILQLVSQISKIEKNHIQMHLLRQNPFQNPYFLTYVESAKLMGPSDTANLIKNVRKYSQADKIQTEPLNTIIFLGQSLLFRINTFIQIKQSAIGQLSNYYEGWKKQKKAHQVLSNRHKQYLHLTKGIRNLQIIIAPRLRRYLSEIKKNTSIISINERIFERYVHKISLHLLGEAFNRVKSIKHETKYKLTKGINLINMARLAGLAIGGRPFFTQINKVSRKQNSVHKIFKIFKTVNYQCLQKAFDQIYLRQFTLHTNVFSCLQGIIKKRYRYPFEKISRHSQEKLYSQLSECNSDCSDISKLKSFVSLASSLASKYPDYQPYIQLRNGNFLKVEPSKVQFAESLPLSHQTQFLQFLCSSNSPSKHIVWLIPQEITISLLEKHYLQALSKSVQESFKKFISKSELLLFFMRHLQKKGQHKNLKTTWNWWRKNVLNQIKNQEYRWRQSFYQTNVEVQNLKSLQKQHKREEEQRDQQMKEVTRLKQLHQRNISHHRSAIVHLEVSSRKLEEEEVKKKYQRNMQDMKRAFQKWRIESKIQTKKHLEKQFEMTSYKHGVNFIKKTIKNHQNNLLKSSFRMIVMNYLDEKARIKREQKRNEKKGLQDRDFNRLMTFQDQFENQIPQKSRDISIIPISFKQFETSRKENVDISQEEARKMNEGAYKLNPKTLKFLKRMGKINGE